VEARYGLEQRALARPVVADEPEDLSFADVQVDALEDGDRPEALDDALDAQVVRAVGGAVLHHSLPAPRNLAT
jgi:phosphopantothenate synthetase